MANFAYPSFFSAARRLQGASRFTDMIRRGVEEINIKIYACSTGAIATLRGQPIKSVGDEVLISLQKAYPSVKFNVFASEKPIAPYGSGYARTGAWYSTKKTPQGTDWWDAPVVWKRQDGRK